ncbi:conserved hypothetical protein [Flavobacterium sp. 9AF]|uniref:tetratricopeptide repeat protein n=1 Tax=Flavobacterium sp. 9AF TaxID=2653142 RepID=UPI0012F39CB2|nr:tetratricopeptide repeat protein [Flavobacterium sp. 9AF]VXB06729.1 conserved hypothetical protein [Flavobacterium sp. 9AF]
MNTTDLTYLLNNPATINEKRTMSLEIVLQQFPFFQSARALHLKGLYNQQSFRYNYELKKTAAHTHDRSILFDFITSETFRILKKEITEDTEKNINNIAVHDASVVNIGDAEEKSPLKITPATFEDNKMENSDITSIHTIVEVLPTAIETTIEKEEEIIVINNSSSIEEKLEIGKPLEFNQAEKHSFQEWLQLTKFSPIERESNDKEEEKQDEKLKKIDLIDRFIELNPKITPTKEATSAPANVQKSGEEQSHLMTETLAKIYLEQKKYFKAIQAYEILILKYPEKSSFFANRIKDIKDLQQNNN